MVLRRHWNGIVLGTALAALLSLPVMAQSAATPSADQSASQPATATHKPPLAAPIKQGFWGRLNPFARKKYVQGQLNPIRDRVNELDGLTADNTKQISTVDANAKSGIAAASDEAKHAADVADAAQQQVQQDQSQADQLNQDVTNTNTKIQGVDQYHVAQTAQLNFRPGRAELSADAQQQLSTFLQGLSNRQGYIVEVTAYSTRRGAAGFTDSQELADAVVRYMVLQQDVPLYRIYTMGLGTAQPGMEAAQMSSSTRRRTIGGTVEVRILQNSLANSSDSSNSSNQS